MRTSLMFAVLSSSLSLGCQIDTAKVADHSLYASQAEVKKGGEQLSFAVVGNVRSNMPGLDRRAGRHSHGEVTEAIVQSLAGTIGSGGPEFIVFTGDMVTQGQEGAWERWDEMWAPVLQGHTLPQDGNGAAQLVRVPSQPVMGDHDGLMDRRYRGTEGAWPGVGAPIGYNRVGSWQSFDVETGGATWRLLFLDSNKAKLGSRWREQLAWIPRALEGSVDGLMVFMHDPLYDLGGVEADMNPDGGPQELLDAVENSSSLSALTAIFFGGRHTSQALLPDGPFGALHVGTGGGGAPSEDLRRWGPAEGTARKDDLALEPLFDLAMQEALTEWNSQAPLPDLVIDQARAQNTFEGFRASYDSAHFPIYGWWQVELAGPKMKVVFWHYQANQTLAPKYMATFNEQEGWKGLKL